MSASAVAPPHHQSGRAAGADLRRVSPASPSELERRWSLVRHHLNERGLDALIALGENNDLGGAVRWLTDNPIAYRKVVICFRDDLMTVIDHGGIGTRRELDGAAPGAPGVGLLIAVSQFPSVHYTQRQELEHVISVLAKRGCRRIGLYNPQAMPHGFVSGLHEALGSSSFSDESDPIDRFKAIKSAEEIEVIRAGAAMQDAVFAKLLADARPGMTDGEIIAVAKAEGARRNGEFGVLMVGSAPPGQPANFFPEGRQARRTEAGDQVSVLVENGASGGYFLELGRHFTFGPAPTALLEVVEQAKAAQAYTLSLLKPGAAFADIFRAYDRYMLSNGLPPERRLFAHGQGYDLIERPLIRDDETMVVEAGMHVTIHPGVQRADVFGFVCDNYLIHADREPECLHRTAKRVFEI